MDHFEKTLQDALAKLHEVERQVVETKQGINSLLKLFGRQPMFADTDLKTDGSPSATSNDRFYGQPLAKVVRWVLEDRRAAGQGAGSVNEIYQAMMAGNYKFDTDNPDNAKRGLRISLTKNSAVFHKLPNGEYGLREWYPAIKDKPMNSKPDDEGETAGNDSGFDFATKEKGAEEASPVKATA